MSEQDKCPFCGADFYAKAGGVQRWPCHGWTCGAVRFPSGNFDRRERCYEREIAALKAENARLETENERLVAVCSHAGYGDYAKRVQAGEDMFPNKNFLAGVPVTVHFRSKGEAGHE